MSINPARVAHVCTMDYAGVARGEAYFGHYAVDWQNAAIKSVAMCTGWEKLGHQVTYFSY
jgi:hypothetical protein